MADRQVHQGALFIWNWDDCAIEAPNQLKNTLDTIIEHGFSGVLARLKQCRYPVVHPRVVRAVTQVSQWAKNRGLPFWFQADPRQASRPLINLSDESAQVLFYGDIDENASVPSKVNMCAIVNNGFNLVFPYPHFRKTSKMDDRALIFMPVALEKAFMFKMKKGQILRKTIRDISSITNFFVNVPENRVEVFGHVNTMGEDDWMVMAFPRFNLNLFDYAGRVANDNLYHFVEDLFDAGAYIDGMTWDTAGYIVDIGRLPVSVSIYNSFIAEFGYDIRDFLYALVMDLDGASHIRIRHDYHDILMKMVYTAYLEFTKVGRSFLGDVQSATSHSWSFRKHPSLSLIQGDMDPWEGLKASSVGMTEMEIKSPLQEQLPLIISQLVATKSLATYSRSKNAFLHLKMTELDDWQYLIDLMAFFSVKPFIDSSQIQVKASVFEFENNFELCVDYINSRIHKINEITQFHLPTAKVGIVYPIDTIMAIGHEKADRMIQNFHHYVAMLTLQGIQLDILSPGHLLEGSIKKEKLKIGHRYYSQLLYPYPTVIRTDVFNRLSVFNSQGFETYFGGTSPKYNTKGEPLPYRCPILFNPEKMDANELQQMKLTGLVHGLKNGIANIVYLGDTQLIMLLPLRPGIKMKGTLLYESKEIELPETNELSIFQIDLHQQVSRKL